MESLSRKVYCYKNAGMIRFIRIASEGIEAIDERMAKKKHRKETDRFTS